MATPPIKYNPAFLSDEELMAAFVVRHDDRDLVLKVIKENTVDANQHVLVIGTRGIGKTMLMQRITLDVRQDEELNQRWHPLVFAEESYEVGTPGEFWLEAIFHLANQTGDSNWQRTYEDLRQEMDEERLTQRALAQLMDFADSQNKRLLLVVENLNMILGQQLTEDCAWKLRHSLMHEPRIMLLATATAEIDLPNKNSQAFFELFKTHELKPLEDDDCQAIWTSIAGHELGSRRIRALSILTGGNPRLLTIISHFGAQLSFSDLMKDLTALVDDHTDYFKSHLEALPSTERKVYVALADIWDPALAREVATAARLEVSKTSSLLKRLVSRGAVTELPAGGRKKRYRVTERMYNVYYLMRRRGAPSERVRAAVHFMVQFYEEKELVEIARRLGDEACKLSCDERKLHYYAFEGLIKAVPQSLQPEIIQCTTTDFLKASDRPDSLKNLIDEIDGKESTRKLTSIHTDTTEARALVRLLGQAEDAHDTERMEQIFDELCSVTTDRAHKAFFLALKLELNREYDEAEAALKKAIDIDRKFESAWLKLALLLHEQTDRTEDIDNAYLSALECSPNNADTWAKYGEFLHDKTNRMNEAEAAYRKALKLNPEFGWAWGQLGEFLHEKTDRHEESEYAYRRAIKERPGFVWPWLQLGMLLHEHTDRYDEAEFAYRKAIEIDPKNGFSWMQLGKLFHEHTDRNDEAEAAYNRAIEDADIAPDGLVLLGYLLCEKTNRYDEAESAYNKALEIDPLNVFALVNLAGLLHLYTERHQEAEKIYRQAIAADPASAGIWLMLGQLLSEQPTRLDDAEDAFRNAIKLDPNAPQARSDLVEFILAHSSNPDKPADVAKEAVAAIPNNADLLNSLAWAFYKAPYAKLPHSALEWAKQAVELEKNNDRIHTLACIIARTQTGSEALNLAREVLKQPDYTESIIDDMVTLFAELVAGGQAKKALQILRDSESAVVLEPILVALRMHVGEDVAVAPEIEQIALDVRKEFDAMIERRKNNSIA